MSPHRLRPTNLRKITEAKGIHLAMKQSGHRSDKYIWRYTQPSDAELERSEDELD